MIDIKVRVHDRFSVEFKIGYLVQKNLKANDFMMNTWIFIPNSLDINSFTYGKTEFYRHAKSNIRYITPIYTLSELRNEEALPFRFLEVAFHELSADHSQENLAETEYQIKMFCSIVKSALRKEADQIIKYTPEPDREKAIDLYIEQINDITGKYRKLKDILQDSGLYEEVVTLHSFGDEFLSNLIEFQTYRLLELIKQKDIECYDRIEDRLMLLIRHERKYKNNINARP